MYVLDTNVLSHTAPTKTRPASELVGWLRRNGGHCYISAVTIAEIGYGAAWLVHRRATRRAADLQSWLRGILAFHRDRVLPIDEMAALRAGELMARARANGVEIDLEDAMIAAVADLRGMIVLTGNARHFAPMGIAFVDPFETLPPDVAPAT